jgi:regulatory protein
MPKPPPDPNAPRKRRYPLRSEDALRELAYRYVARFSCTTDKVRRYLLGKMREAVAAEEARAADIQPWIDAVLAALVRVGALDDRRFAENRALTLHRRGRGTRVIQRDLDRLGAPDEAIDQALETLAADIPDPDLVAAIRLARKRRLGPFAAPETRRELRERHLAALARAGFRFDLARRIVDAPDADALLERIGGAL